MSLAPPAAARDTYTAIELARVLLAYPAYRVLLCAETVIPPSPWTGVFQVDVDHDGKVIRLAGDFT